MVHKLLLSIPQIPQTNGCIALSTARWYESDDVEIFYDRRQGTRAGAWRGEDRRKPSDVEERIVGYFRSKSSISSAMCSMYGRAQRISVGTRHER